MTTQAHEEWVRLDMSDIRRDYDAGVSALNEGVFLVVTEFPDGSAIYWDEIRATWDLRAG